MPSIDCPGCGTTLHLIDECYTCGDARCKMYGMLLTKLEADE